MKKILISTILVSALGLSFIGCGSSSSSNDEKIGEKSDTPAYLNIPQIADQNVRLDGKEFPILEFSSSENISYRISGGNGKDLFEIKNNKLYYIGDSAGDYTLKINAHDNSSGANGAAREFHINVIGETTLDTTPPNFTLPTSMKVGESVTLLVSNEDDTVTFETSSNDFTIDGVILTAPDTAGDYNLSVKATDMAGNTSDVNATINVQAENVVVENNNSIIGGLEWTSLIPDDDSNPATDGKITQVEARNICVNMGMRLPVEADFEPNSIALKADTKFLPSSVSSEVPEHLNVWIDDLNKVYHLDIDALHLADNEEDYVYTDDINSSSAYYYTCVKPAN